MKLRYPVIILTIALLPLSTNVFAAEAITESAARTVVDAVEAAMKKNDALGVANNLSADCIIKVSSPTPNGGRQNHQETREQFIVAQQEDAKHTTDYHYQSSVQKVSIVDGKAVARVHSTSTYTENNQHLQISEDAVETLELRAGRVFVTEVDVQEVGLTADGRRFY
ncbi:MAG: hypothetical protein ABIT64_03450 [Lysobacteraceae bacterium]